MVVSGNDVPPDRSAAIPRIAASSVSSSFGCPNLQGAGRYTTCLSLPSASVYEQASRPSPVGITVRLDNPSAIIRHGHVSTFLQCGASAAAAVTNACTQLERGTLRGALFACTGGNSHCVCLRADNGRLLRCALRFGATRVPAHAATSRSRVHDCGNVHGMRPLDGER